VGEILGLGLTHYPPLVGRDENMAGILRTILRDPGLPERYRDPATGRRRCAASMATTGVRPPRPRTAPGSCAASATPVRRSTTSGRTSSSSGRRPARELTDDVIPPFCVSRTTRSRRGTASGTSRRPTSGRGSDTVFRIKGHREAGKYLTRRLLEQGVDMAYAYRPLHHAGLAHAFLNTVMFLDYDRGGFPYPVVAFQVNCYGRRVIASAAIAAASSIRSQRRISTAVRRRSAAWKSARHRAGGCAKSPWRTALTPPPAGRTRS